MFDGKKINSLEQSVTTLTEELARANETIVSLNNTIESLFENVEEIIAELNRTKTELNNKYDSVVKEVNVVEEKIDNVANKSNTADTEHGTQLKLLNETNNRLVKKCEDLQLANVQIMNQHNDMVKRYEQSIKEYAELTQHMKENILKKMNAKNIVSVVEE